MPEQCPIEFKGNNAPQVKDVLGTGIVSVLSGHSRYQHSSSLYGDMAAASMLGMNKFVSHDSFSRGIARPSAKRDLTLVRVQPCPHPSADGSRTIFHLRENH